MTGLIIENAFTSVVCLFIIANDVFKFLFFLKNFFKKNKPDMVDIVLPALKYVKWLSRNEW